VVHSPAFKDADYRSGHTQYGDAMQRASFWKYVHELFDEIRNFVPPHSTDTALIEASAEYLSRQLTTRAVHDT
jgi:hypothetical protein